METMVDLISLLMVVIRIGVICRVTICLLKIIINNDESGVAENKAKIKNSLIFLVLSESVWVIRDIINYYYNIS